MALSLNCANQPTEATLQVSKVENPESKFPTYQLVFKEHNKIIARRYFQGGKTVLAEGEIPTKIINVVDIELIREGDPVPDMDLRRVKEIVYSSNEKVIARMVRRNGKLVLADGKIPNGIILERYEDGRIRSVCTRSNGARNGPAIGLYPSGRIKIEATYEEDYPSGIVRRYYENGNLMIEEEFSNKKVILRKEYHDNGQLEEELHYKEGKIKGNNYWLDGSSHNNSLQWMR